MLNSVGRQHVTGVNRTMVAAATIVPFPSVTSILLLLAAFSSHDDNVRKIFLSYSLCTVILTGCVTEERSSLVMHSIALFDHEIEWILIDDPPQSLLWTDTHMHHRPLSDKEGQRTHRMVPISTFTYLTSVIDLCTGHMALRPFVVGPTLTFCPRARCFPDLRRKIAQGACRRLPSGVLSGLRVDWHLIKMAHILQTTFSDTVSLKKMFGFKLTFHRSLLLKVQMAIRHEPVLVCRRT